MANKFEYEQGSLSQMDEEMTNLDKQPVLENLLVKYADYSREKAFAKTENAYNILQRIHENPVDVDGNEKRIKSLHHCASLCSEAAHLHQHFGKAAEEYRPHFEFKEQLELDYCPMANLIGREHAKKVLRETLIVPTKLAESNKCPLSKTGSSVLFFGPTQSGKSEIVCAAVLESKYPYVWVDKTTVASQWRGQTCDLMNLLFAQATQYNPCVIVLDGIDSMTASGGSEGSMLTCALFSHLDKAAISNNIIVLAIAHYPSSLDFDLLRRFEQKIYVPLPNEAERSQYFELYLNSLGLEHNIKDEAILKFAANTPRFSGYDIFQTVQMARMILERDCAVIPRNDDEELLVLQESYVTLAASASRATNDESTIRSFEVQYKRHGTKPLSSIRNQQPRNVSSFCCVM